MNIEIRNRKYQIVTLDFETYYAADYTLMTSSMSGYIRDPQFKIHGVGIYVDGHYRWVTDDFEFYLRTIDWDSTALLCQNTLFDAYILAYHFGIYPAFLMDTAGMSRLHFGVGFRHDLDALSQRCGGQGKTLVSALVKTKGIRDLDSDTLKALGKYCREDCVNTYNVFLALYPHVPDAELRLIDLTVRLFTKSPLVVNAELAYEELMAERDKKYRMVADCAVSAEDLMSNQKFAELLVAAGVNVPTKVSPKTGKITYAFAKTDGGFQCMLDSDDIVVRKLCEARLAVKSSIGETRAQRLIDEGTGGKRLPVGLTYAAAKTHRWGGTNKMNLQNLQRQQYLPTGGMNPATGRLRRSIQVDEGKVIIVNDLSQIEVRMSAWWSGQLDLLEDFKNSVDIYKKMASKVFGKPMNQISKQERFLGKCCLAAGTPILTDSGYKPIEAVKRSDRLWDGVEWVSHEGIVYQGFKEVITHGSITGTSDHWCVSEHGDAIQIGDAASSMVGFMRSARPDGTPIRLCPDSIPDHPPQEWIPVRGSQMLGIWDYEIDEFGQLTQWENEFVLQERQNPILPVQQVVDGSVAAQGFDQRADTCKAHVYDILNAGPRRCFTAGDGRLVFNCVLGLGYGMGAPKLQLTLELGLLGGGKVIISLAEAQLYVSVYRSTFPFITNGWRVCDRFIQIMIHGGTYTFNGVTATKNQLAFPNGTRIYYHNIRETASGEVIYDLRVGVARIYGAILYENIIQKLARDVIAEQLLAVDDIPELQIITTTHDEIAALADEAYADKGLLEMQRIMNTAPAWCKGIPLASEGGYARNYSK